MGRISTVYVRLDDVGVAALRSALHHRGRHHETVLDRVTSKRVFTNWPGQKRKTLVRKGRLQFHGACVRVDLIVDRPRACRRPAAWRCRARRPEPERAGRRALVYLDQVLLRQGKDDRDRPQLRDDNETVRVRRMNDVALVNKPAECRRARRSARRCGCRAIWVCALSMAAASDCTVATNWSTRYFEVSKVCWSSTFLASNSALRA